MAKKPSPYNNVERELTLVGNPLPSDELEIELPTAAPEPSFDGMEMSTLEDGSVEFAEPDAENKGEAKFMDNLAEFIDDDELTGISSMVLEKVDEDKASRNEWLSTYTKGLDLLGVKYDNRT